MSELMKVNENVSLDGVLEQNHKLASEYEKLKAENVKLNERIDGLKEENEKLKAEQSKLFANLKDASALLEREQVTIETLCLLVARQR